MPASCRAMEIPSTNRTDPTKPNACRDRELLHYVGRQGIVTIEHVMGAMKAGRAVTYKRVARCIELGLLERHDVLRTEPSILRATREGLDYARLGLPVASISPGTLEHDLRCATAAIALEEWVGPTHIATEREIALVERQMGKPVASAAVGEGRRGKTRYHRGDLLQRFPDGKAFVIEIELTSKAPRRLEEILMGWYRAKGINGVVYFCRAGKTYRGVERAIARKEVGKRIIVRDIEELLSRPTEPAPETENS